ncbi:MAG: hypothetical protein Q8O03_05930 [Nanoarchaeota archaeon]|nr:hypothetical protein [Nanoarchaeota archaeon]
MEKPKIDQVIARLEKEDITKWKRENLKCYPKFVKYTLETDDLSVFIVSYPNFDGLFPDFGDVLLSHTLGKEGRLKKGFEHHYELRVMSKECDKVNVSYRYFDDSREIRYEQKMIDGLFNRIEELYKSEELKKWKEHTEQDEGIYNQAEKEFTKNLDAFLKG